MKNKIALFLALWIAAYGCAPLSAAPVQSAGPINYNVGTMNIKNKIALYVLGAIGVAALAVNSVIKAGAEDSSVSTAYAYPVPYNPATQREITFTLLPTQGNIKIYTVTGELVREIGFSSPVDGKVTWDARNTQGEDLGSDVYVYIISSGDNKKFGKLMVVR